MTRDPKGDKELIDHIGEAWASAQQQLDRLRDAVAENVALGSAKARFDRGRSEREEKLQVLGEATLQHFKRAAPPAELKVAFEAARAAEARLAKERASISDILQEAEVVREKAAKRRK